MTYKPLLAGQRCMCCILQDIVLTWNLEPMAYLVQDSQALSLQLLLRLLACPRLQSTIWPCWKRNQEQEC